jgi:hypothetical protein
MREHQINIRLSAEEFEQHEAVRASYGIPISWLFRLWLKSAYERISEEKPKTKPKKG